MHKSIAVLPLIAIAWSAPAIAGEEPLYADAPEWVEPVDTDAAIAAGHEVVIFDRHYRLEDGVVSQYTDIAYEMRSSQTLQRFGTLQFGWLPDKGDLIIHRVHIIRDGEVVDVIAGGAQPEILRRERRLEAQSLDGALTAALPVPGLQVGDILRYSFSTTLSDQALQNAMQAQAQLTPEPAQLGFGRVVFSWPEDADIHWRAVGQAGEHQEVTRGGYDMVEIALPIAEPEEMPTDAPGRYAVGPTLQAGTFASWEDVSRLMAPHFATEGTIDPNGPVAAEIARIAAATDDKTQQAALALQVVQDEINYLMNGLDGGNYLPQMPEETWELRYGDCKAKSMLLLAMLRELDIEAVAVLVDTNNSDAAAVFQPLPGAFNHMIVRAEIDGTTYYMDGTSAGTRVDTMYEVPDYIYALPLVEGGADLARVEQRWPIAPDQIVRVTYDMSGGVDLPSLYDIEVETRGVYAAQFRAQAAETNPQAIIGNAHTYLTNIVDGILVDAEYHYDEATGVGTLRARGLQLDRFALDRDTATHALATATTNWEFAPDRARRAWRDIPYAVGGPLTIAYESTYLLPEGESIAVNGTHDLDGVTAGTRFNRSITVEGRRVHMEDGYSYIPTEIAAGDIAEGRAQMRQLASGDPQIVITDPVRSWELDDAELARRMASFEQPIDTMLTIDRDNAGYPLMAGVLWMYARDHERALDFFDRSLEIEDNPQTHLLRANVLTQLGRYHDALAAAEIAHDQQGNLESASALAQMLVEMDRADDALDLLDSLGLSGQDANNVVTLWADISGHAGRQEEAWARLSEALMDRPGDGQLLNAQCWLAGTWETNLDAAGEVCDEAVSALNYSASVLDSRALMHYRAGNVDAAMADLDAALRKEPGIAASMYLRGLIKLEQGDRSGAQDLEQARRIAPTIDRQYGHWGLAPTS
ncbi:DUF3857 domain-containing protein [Aurantiacibacter gangjinensis]|uniref:DUF3857 domain-containing protein n=1 Tax=Aurantiacibacter gangjinensis TaxID=502682 RepID=A0A0G9MTP8_9SPHN|nr:DUF3857 domain-containing protein [Aurantiacibacter gangjinensis]KLE32663.1 hypothetical protein AAW01_00985 [Aurantiacibacter gangjinensis]